MSGNAMNNLSYGLSVITACKDGCDNGCITNTVSQVTSNPKQITVALNKESLTRDFIKETGVFSVSVLSEAATFDVFKHFGFQSGRDIGKFAGYKYCRKVSNNTMAITKGTNAYISAKVVDSLDLGTHTLFVAKVINEEVISSLPSATYSYYQEYIKPKVKHIGVVVDIQSAANELERRARA